MDSPLDSVMRRVLNTDFTDYTDFYWGGASRQEGLGPIVRQHKNLSVLSVLSVVNKDIRGSVVEPDRGEEAAPDGQVGGGVDLAADL